MLRHVFPVEIAGGEDLQDASDDSGDNADLQKDACINAIAALQQVERSDS
jgi:hypothetical protein